MTPVEAFKIILGHAESFIQHWEDDEGDREEAREARNEFEKAKTLLRVGLEFNVLANEDLSDIESICESLDE